MRSAAVLGYLFSAGLYLMAWINPYFGSGRKLIQWVAFERLCLAEFLTCHAATLLAAIAMTTQMENSEPGLQAVFGALIGLYGVFGLGAYAMHRDHSVLLGFYLMLAIRALNLISIRNAELDVMRSEVLKNFLMSMVMMMLIAAIVLSNDILRTFIDNQSSLPRKLATGRPLLFVAGYYVLWAVIEWTFPERIAE
jgi:hypothetical protein